MRGKLRKNVKLIILFAICFLFVSNIQAVYAKTEETITVKYYMMLLEKILGKNSSKPLQTAVEIGLVKGEETWDISKLITNEQAAVLANRADIIKRKDNIYEKDIYEDVKYKKRISDISTIIEKNREEVYQVFVKGIMVGESNGMYSQSRKFSGSKKLLRKEAFSIVKRIEDVKKRKKISPDGQLIRTTNLPYNYKDYNYILESFPNAFYEKKFEFQGLKLQSHITINGQDKWIDKKLVELKDFARPVHYINRPQPLEFMGEMYTGKPIQDMLDTELDIWTKKIETNLKLRLNINYKTINNKWFTNLRNTYLLSINDNYLNKRISGYLKDYVRYVKENQIVLESKKIVVEPSTLYYCRSMDYIRCYVEFRMVSAKDKKRVAKDGKYIFTTTTSKIKNIESGNWICMYIDIPLSAAMGCEKSISEYSPFIN